MGDGCHHLPAGTVDASRVRCLYGVCQETEEQGIALPDVSLLYARLSDVLLDRCLDVDCFYPLLSVRHLLEYGMGVVGNGIPSSCPEYL